MDQFLQKGPSFGSKRKLNGSVAIVTPAKKSASKESGKGIQMFLDIGQKFGATKQCAQCGMLLVVSDLEDGKRHAKFCKEVKKNPTIPTLDGHKVRAQFNHESECVIEVKSSQKHHYRHIQSVLQVAEKELGCSEDFVSIDCFVALLMRYSQISEERIAYLYVRSDLSVIGCAIVEPVPLHTTVRLERAEDVSVIHDSSPSSIRENVDRNADSKPVTSPTASSSCSSSTLGIRLIWVATEGRRQGVAARLVDCARQFHQYGSVVPKSLVAFSQPTADGFAFASAYCGGDGSVLGY